MSIVARWIATKVDLAFATSLNGHVSLQPPLLLRSFSNYHDVNRSRADIGTSRIITKTETVFVSNFSVAVCLETRTESNSRHIWIFEGRIFGSGPCGDAIKRECLVGAHVILNIEVLLGRATPSRNDGGS